MLGATHRRIISGLDAGAALDLPVHGPRPRDFCTADDIIDGLCCSGGEAAGGGRGSPVSFPAFP